MNQWRKDAYIDVVNFLLGLALFISPWVIGGAMGIAARSAWVGGFLIAVVALLALFSFAEWEEWASLIFGLGVLIAPWTVGFYTTNPELAHTHVVIGIIVAALAAWELWSLHSSPPPRHA